MGEKKQGNNFNAPLPDPEVAVVFRDWCKARKVPYGGTTQAALELFMVSPPDLAELARMGRTEDMRAWLGQARPSLDDLVKRLSEVESRLNRMMGADAEDRLEHVSKAPGESPHDRPVKGAGKVKRA